MAQLLKPPSLHALIVYGATHYHFHVAFFVFSVLPAWDHRTDKVRRPLCSRNSRSSHGTMGIRWRHRLARQHAANVNGAGCVCCVRLWCVSIAFKLIANQSISTWRTLAHLHICPTVRWWGDLPLAAPPSLSLPFCTPLLLHQVLQFCSGSHWTLCLRQAVPLFVLLLHGIVLHSPACCTLPPPLTQHYAPRLHYETLDVVVVAIAIAPSSGHKSMRKFLQRSAVSRVAAPAALC